MRPEFISLFIIGILVMAFVYAKYPALTRESFDDFIENKGYPTSQLCSMPLTSPLPQLSGPADTTLDEARVRARQLNAQDFVKRQEERIQRIAIEENNNKKKYDSVLPIEFVEEFESRYLRTRDSETRKGRRKNSHARSKWKAAQKMIVALKIDPSEWY